MGIPLVVNVDQLEPYMSEKNASLNIPTLDTSTENNNPEMIEKSPQHTRYGRQIKPPHKFSP